MPTGFQAENCTYINSKNDDNDDRDNNKVKPAAYFIYITLWDLYISPLRDEPVLSACHREGI